MDDLDYDDPEVEERWCEQQRQSVADYFHSQGVQHGRIGEWPAWHLAPYVSVWAIESRMRPEWIGWWVICGDLPTDYILAADIEYPQHPRKAIRAIAERWLKLLDAWSKGLDEYEGFRIGDRHSRQELAPLLEARAKLLIDFADDDGLWEEVDEDSA
jgi:hypothetical protein